MKNIFLILSILGASFLLQACSSSSSSGVPDYTISSSTSGGSVKFASSALQLNQTTTVTAVFTKTDGTPAAGLPVTFSTTLGALSPASGSATTDGTGTASIQLLAGAVSGSGLVTASASINGVQIVKSGTFSVTLPPLTLSSITLGLATISYGGSTSVTVTVLDANNNPYTAQSVVVAFNSVKVAAGQATITPTVTTNSSTGTATATYQANTNTGTDTITASINGSSVQAKITVNPLNAQSITFVSATPTNIGLALMGGQGYTVSSKVVFKVLDTSGSPKANQLVDFSLNTALGGLSLQSTSASSDGNGLVSTYVNAGNYATPVIVTAKLDGVVPVISTQSSQLVVSTGVPTFDGFSLSIVTYNPESYGIDGVTDTVTIRMSDHFHNPVPDGTAVSFQTNGGSITPSCTSVGGACSVTWTSQNPRPGGYYVPSSGGYTNPGRATILAYTVGEESFVDTEGKTVCEDASEFTPEPEAYMDENENGVRDDSTNNTILTEPFIDYLGTGVYRGHSSDTAYNSEYYGILQGPAYTGQPTSIMVFSNLHLVMATSAASISTSGGNPIHVAKGGDTSFTVTVSDLNGNTMAQGTSVAFNLATVSSTPGSTEAYVLTANSFTFPNSNANHGVVLPVTIANPGDSNVPPNYALSGILTVTVTSPSGYTTTATYSVASP